MLLQLNLYANFDEAFDVRKDLKVKGHSTRECFRLHP